MRSKKYYLFFWYTFLKKKKDNEKIFMELDYFTYFCFSCWKWLHIEVPCDFFHSNALFCCVFFVHFDPLAFESYFSCPRAVLIQQIFVGKVFTPCWTYLNYLYFQFKLFYIQFQAWILSYNFKFQFQVLI